MLRSFMPYLISLSILDISDFTEVYVMSIKSLASLIGVTADKTKKQKTPYIITVMS